MKLGIRVSEIEIYCSDPRKYSYPQKKEFTATDGVLNIVNEGTVPVSIDYDVQTTSQTEIYWYRINWKVSCKYGKD